MLQRYRKTLVAGIAALVIAQPALAVLQRQGPIDAVHGFPQWFQDRNGVALEICSINDPVNGLAVVAAGLCAIANAPAPAGVQVAPEVFPTQFSAEHFYTLTTATLTPAGVGATGIAGPGRVVFNFALEGGFATGTPAQGQQIWFTRWRVNHTSVACNGNHTYYTPMSAPQTFVGVARGRVFETSDTGLGNTAAVLTGNIGPFLLASSAAGGAPKAPFIGPDGKKYLADSAVTTPITGSLVPNALANSSNPFVTAELRAMPYTNYVAVEGPGVATGNCAATELVYSTSFSLFGRLYEGPIPSRNSVDRASYRVVDSNGDGIPDTFQIGTWATATQEANRPVPRLGLSLWFTDPTNPASSTAEVGMESMLMPSSNPVPPGVLPTPVYAQFQGMTAPTQISGTTTLPGPVYTSARVRVLTDTPVSVQDVNLVDELRINQAVWNSVAKTLTVSAESGAYLQTPTPATGQTAANGVCSVPCLTLNAYGLPLTDAANAAIDFKMKTPTTAKATTASIVVPNVLTPPAFVTVTSSSGGRDTQPVMYQGTATGVALFQPDVVNVPKDTPVNVDVFANDLGVAAVPALTLCSAATGGTCAVPNPATACVAGVASPQCTALGGRLALNGNLVSYTPPQGVGGVTDTFWYQAATVNGTTVRTPVSAVISALGGPPDARDDLGNAAVVGLPVSIDVLANDFAPAGINLATLRITQEPCNFATGSCAPGSASFNSVPGKLVFTPPAVGQWNLAYTFADSNGVVADPGVVAVNALASETVTILRALWKPTTGTAGTLATDGNTTISLGQRVQLMALAAGQTNGCSNPGAGTVLGTAVVGAGGIWSFAATTLATKPTAVYLVSPSFGGCAQVTVQ